MRIDNVVTSGLFKLDGGQWEVDNNVWIVGDDSEVYIIDAAHDAKAIADAVGSRRVKGIIATHGHSDHIDAAPELSKLVNAPVYLHPTDGFLWQRENPNCYYLPLEDGKTFQIAGTDLKVLSTRRKATSSFLVTRSSRVGRVQRGAPFLPSTPSLTPCRSQCWICRRRPRCTPVTVTTPRSGRKHRTSRSGSGAGIRFAGVGSAPAAGRGRRHRRVRR